MIAVFRRIDDVHATKRRFRGDFVQKRNDRRDADPFGNHHERRIGVVKREGPRGFRHFDHVAHANALAEMLRKQPRVTRELLHEETVKTFVGRAAERKGSRRKGPRANANALSRLEVGQGRPVLRNEVEAFDVLALLRAVQNLEILPTPPNDGLLRDIRSRFHMCFSTAEMQSEHNAPPLFISIWVPLS